MKQRKSMVGPCIFPSLPILRTMRPWWPCLVISDTWRVNLLPWMWHHTQKSLYDVEKPVVCVSWGRTWQCLAIAGWTMGDVAEFSAGYFFGQCDGLFFNRAFLCLVCPATDGQ